MNYLYLKSLHLIFIVTWFSGLFYIVRLFIYHVEAEKKEAPIRDTLQHQYRLMSKRLWYIITWPSAVLVIIFGGWMLYLRPGLLMEDWMLVKLTFVMVVYAYHFSCHKIFRQQQGLGIRYRAITLRLWNEVATILLVSIVFVAVLKSAIHWMWGVLGIVIIIVALFLMAKLYKNIRAKKSWDTSEMLEEKKSIGQEIEGSYSKEDKEEDFSEF